MKVWLLVKDEFTYENRRFREEAEKEGIEIKFVNSVDFDIIVNRNGGNCIVYGGNYVEPPDCVIPRRGAGTTYFDLAFLRQLERMGVLVVNSSQSIEISKDKLQTLQLLSANNIPIPKTMLAKLPLDIDVVEREFSYPIIIKTISGSRGKGVFLCEDRNQLEDFVGFMEVSMDPRVNLIIQEFVEESRGKDIRVLVVGGKAIGAMLRVAREGKVKANYSAGGSVSAYNLTPELEWLAVESAKIVGLDIAGVDILFDSENYLVCEINSSPGFEGFEKATGINVPQAIFRYLKFRVSRSSSINRAKKDI